MSMIPNPGMPTGEKLMLGYGLRQQHFSAWLQVDPPPWLEVMVDDIIGHRGGPGLAAVGPRLSRLAT